MLGFDLREPPSVESVLVDFHTHTLASDGALAPAALLDRAAGRGVARFAITDHDTIAGFLSVRGHSPQGLELVPGVELSCTWGKTTIHVVGLGFDPDAPSLGAALASLDAARCARAERIAARLEARGYPGALAGARALAGTSQIGRPHFAEWLVSAGHFPDTRTVFRRLLGQGKVGDVKQYWPTLAETAATLRDAGGLAILAHPLHYRLTRMKLRALCADFRAAGGQALELVNGRQQQGDTDILRRLAAEFGFAVSLGSDFHRDGPHSADLGVDSGCVGDLEPVWARLA